MDQSQEVNDKVFKEEFSAEEIIRYYSKWAEDGKYNKDLSCEKYQGPYIVAKTVAGLIPKELREQTKILDVAAGTGLVSSELHDYGFHLIDAIDPCDRMLKEARSKSLYKNYYCEFLTYRSLLTFNETYDCVTCSGGFGKGHLPVSSLHDMARLCKKDGYIVIAMREEYLFMECYHGILEPEMKKMENNNTWKIVERKVVQNFAFNLNGVLFVFKKL